MAVWWVARRSTHHQLRVAQEVRWVPKMVTSWKEWQKLYTQWPRAVNFGVAFLVDAAPIYYVNWRYWWFQCMSCVFCKYHRVRNLRQDCLCVKHLGSNTVFLFWDRLLAACVESKCWGLLVVLFVCSVDWGVSLFSRFGMLMVCTQGLGRMCVGFWRVCD